MQDHFLLIFADFLTFQATLTELGENYEDGWMDGLERLTSLELTLVLMKTTQR